jgi:hypothetical protein
MRYPATIVLMLALAFTTGACAGRLIKVNGIEIREQDWQRTLEELRPRVSFDMCPAEQTTFVLLSRGSGVPTQVGVVGCSKRAVYVRGVAGSVRGPWILNSGAPTQQASTDSGT